MSCRALASSQQNKRKNGALRLPHVAQESHSYNTTAAGVNFTKRLRAESLSTYMCPEHHLLSPDRKKFLDGCLKFAQTRGGDSSGEGGSVATLVRSIERARAQLNALLQTSETKARSQGRGKGR